MTCEVLRKPSYAASICWRFSCGLSALVDSATPEFYAGFLFFFRIALDAIRYICTVTWATVLASSSRAV